MSKRGDREDAGMNRNWKCGGVLLVLMTLAVTTHSQPGERSGPVFTKEGELVLPTGYRKWIFVGAPITPNGLNNGRAPFLHPRKSSSPGAMKMKRPSFHSSIRRKPAIMFLRS